MCRPRIHFVTSFPPPFTGQNVATATLFGFLEGVADQGRTDTAPARVLAAQGRIRRTGAVGRALLEAVGNVRQSRPDVLYLVLSSSAEGRLRDAATVRLLRPHVGRIVGHVHVGDFADSLGRPGLRAVSRWMLRHVDRVLALSSRLAEGIEPHVPGRVRVVPNTVSPVFDVSADVVAQARAERADAATLRVAFVSNALPGKGHEVVAEGVAAYQATNPERPAEVDVVGAWPSDRARAAFEARLDALGIADRVRVWGAVADRGRLRRLSLDAHVAVLPSRYAHEALPVTLVEALATGTPVVGTDWRSIPDLVTPRTGVLLRDRTGEAVADALRQLADPATWAERSRDARALYEASYSRSAVRRAFFEALWLKSTP